ncbi:hypothetical protein EHQ53_16060 [Leptospira langatensis]|uniref:Uncharacterized protein n=1 Tax=Leptospira langatensis TaxID=2484983 RepID=A0A5F1ZMU4_9LEPT|nr:hypothetical protein [Leptospira langatensis]TGK05157.1 hypothetical protein EHO57_00300 [Leptospira langatensis]TGL38294.1 hypothetical protein EHQ53_16060 [Leptospira langatensis]
MRTVLYRTVFLLPFLFAIYCDSRPRNINTILKDASIPNYDMGVEGRILHLQFSDFEEDTFSDQGLRGNLSLVTNTSSSYSLLGGSKVSSDQNLFQSKMTFSNPTHSLLFPKGKYSGILEIDYKRSKLFGAMVHGGVRIFFGRKENSEVQASDSCVGVPSSSDETFQSDYLCPSLDSDHPISLELSLVKNTRIRWGISGLWWTGLAGISVWSLASSPLGLIVVGAARGGIFLVPIFKYQELSLKQVIPKQL